MDGKIVEALSKGNRLPAEKIAEYLSWPPNSFHRKPRFDGCLLLTLGEEPALAISDSGGDPLAFAYHSGYEWVFDVRTASPTISNTCWRTTSGVYSVPGEEQISKVCETLTPYGFESDLPAKTALSIQTFDKQVLPIEFALIKKLGELRKMAFRYSMAAPEVLDREIHLLITQLFVLRAIEDLGLGSQKGLEPLSKCVADGQLNLNQLEEIYKIAGQVVQPKLFDKSPLTDLAPIAVASAITALYEQPDIPGSPNLNFAWIDPDVFGSVYERYLSTVLAEAPPPMQSSLFEIGLREVEELSQRKQGGVYYTPQPLVRTLVQKALDVACPDGLALDSLPRIADFSCGSGAFLAGALDKILKGLPADQRTLAAQRIVSEKLLVGVDIDERAVALARLNIYLRLAQENEILPLPDLDACVVQGDALEKQLPDQLEALTFDAIVGNPPFLPTRFIQDKEALVANFRSASGRFDFSSLFVELALKRVKPLGAVALVVPNRIFTNKSAQRIRDLVIEYSNIDTIVDFGSNNVFQGVSAYIGLLICRRTSQEMPPQPYKCVRVRRLSDAFSLEPVTRAIFSPDGSEGEDIEVFFEEQPIIGATWSYMAPSLRFLLSRVEAKGKPLSDVADARQGIKTGANYVYILRLIQDSDQAYVEVEDVSGRRHYLERNLLRPVTTGPEITRYVTFGGMSEGSHVIIYPYSRGVPLPEQVLRDECPRIYAYLSGFRNELASRISVGSSAQPWFGLIRPRDDAWLSCAKLLTRDLISSPSFSIDRSGGTYLVGGVGIMPVDTDHLLPLLGILNSRLFDEVLRVASSSYRGEFIKVEPGRLLTSYIPTQLLDDQDFYDLVAQRLSNPGNGDEIESEIDRMVMDSIGS